VKHNAPRGAPVRINNNTTTAKKSSPAANLNEFCARLSGKKNYGRKSLLHFRGSRFLCANISSQASYLDCLVNEEYGLLAAVRVYKEVATKTQQPVYG